jgi:hypothetical protein
VPTETPDPSPTASPGSTPISTPPPSAPAETDFYVDALTGDDSNDGLSASTAWKSLAPVNATTFDAGDRILLRAGTRYTGHFQLQGSGTADAPIIVTSYGTGVLPGIDGNGLPETLLLQNGEYWEISNLEITNTGAAAAPGRNGILVKVQDFGVAHHIVLQNLYVHDVNGSNVKLSGSGQGIFLVNGGSTIPSSFDDLQVKNCHLLRCDRNGICMGSDYYWRKNWNPNHHVVIDGNLLEDIGGDGIVVISCDGALVQNNVLNGGRRRAQDYAAGIWPWSCDNTVLQFNEVTGMVGTNDGEAYDCDYNCTGTIFQYNYSHDNVGGFMLICNDGSFTPDKNIGNVGSIIRYNLSQNDGTRSFQFAGPVSNTQIYNNVIYTGPAQPQMIAVSWGSWGAGTPTNTVFSNNIFEGTSGNSFAWPSTPAPVYSHNCLYGVFQNPPPDAALITADPLFVAPGTGGAGFGTLSGYLLMPGSPCSQNGILINNNGGFDFWGDPVDPVAPPNIGADNH